MFEQLKENLEREKKIVADIISINVSMQTDPSNRGLYIPSINALREQLVLLNNTVPQFINEWSSVSEEDKPKVLPKKEETAKVVYVKKDTKEKVLITVNKKDKKSFLKSLKLSEDSFSVINKEKQKASGAVLNRPSEYVRLSNKLFRKISDSISNQFADLGRDLKQSNSRYMLSSYLSMAIMSVFLVTIFGLLIFTGLIAFNLSNWKWVFLPVGLAGVVMAIFYMYPSSVASSTQKKISQELPFASIHMSAIASSNIEPSKILKIIAGSPEYPNVAKELRKVIAQVDVYGYDLVVSLKNVAKRTSNKDLAELFSGLATNISTGGGLKNYLEKKSESFLNNYRLERKKYTDLAGTFMDVYISILIAAPLIMMMMFIVMNVAGLGMAGLSMNMLMILSICGIVLVNIIFIVVLSIKQPKV